jgi:hypothetical protein
MEVMLPLGCRWVLLLVWAFIYGLQESQTSARGLVTEGSELAVQVSNAHEYPRVGHRVFRLAKLLLQRRPTPD